MKRTAGNWDLNDAPVYFLAGNTSRLEDVFDSYPFILIAINEMEGPGGLDALDRWVEAGARVMLDSGVFNLATTNAKKRGLTMDEGLALPPEEVEGFDELFDRYCHIVSKHGDKLWGYVEIDQGGRDNKRRTRERLHKMGFDPMPVYHPFNDGWDYFDELAQGYERICFGNVVQADAPTRKRLAATAWERRRYYPHLWIHLLGYTPDERLCAMPSDSADSSTWMAPLRWPVAASVRCAGRTLGPMLPGLRYRLGSDRHDIDGACKATQLSALNCFADMRNWGNLLKDYNRLLGADHRGTLA